MIKFIPENHTYIHDNGEQYESISSMISKYKHPFDAHTISAQVSRRKTSKWYGMAPEKIREAWSKEAERACTLGNWYHSEREKDLIGCSTIESNNNKLMVYQSLEVEGIKIASEQKLKDGLYPEHLIYLETAKKAGQSDLIEISNGFVNIIDYKTNKEIKFDGYKRWNGQKDKMLKPLQHLDDVNFMHYSLQLSAYMYMILKHNPLLSAGNMLLHHVIFEEENEKDEYGYPLIKYSPDGPIVKEVKIIKCPYLKYEIKSIIYD